MDLHFLLTNDDGIEAPGLAALAAAVSAIPGATYTIAAPDREYSQCGHRVTTTEVLKVRQKAERAYAVSGTPADCVRAAVFGLGIKPDFVLSGVNAGGNMGQDLVISGTVAGAREAAYHGLRSAAFSHYLVKGIALDWERTARWTTQLIEWMLGQDLADGAFWNVNFPHLPPGEDALPTRAITSPARPPMLVSYDGTAGKAGEWDLRYTARYADRPAPEGSDVNACFGGEVSVSRLSVVG